MSLPIMLRSAMTGAPSLSSNNGSLNALLLACLVNGFNTKAPTSASSTGSVVSLVYAADPGFEVGSTIAISGATNALYNGNFRVVTTGTTVTVANAAAPAGTIAGTLSTKYAPLGWTRPYSGTGIGCYRQGGTAAHKRYYRVYDNTLTASQFFVRGYEAMTAVSTGTGPFPTVAQAAGNGAALTGPTMVPPAVASWAVFGTPRAFYLILGYSADRTGDLDNFSTDAAAYVFGDLAGLLNAGDTFAQVAPSGWTMTSPLWATRAYNGVAGAVTAQAYGPGGPSASLGVPAPNPGGGDVLVAGPMIVLDAASSAARGFLPGVLSMYNTPAYSGVVPNMSSTPAIPGITGRLMHLYNFGSGATGEVGFLLDEDWGDV